LTIAVELDRDSLNGTVSGGGQPVVRFGNWLELLSAIEGRRPKSAEPPTTTSNERTSE
jgi:hypothetical protein